LPMALLAATSGPGGDRDLQSLLLRRGARRARAPGEPRTAETAEGSDEGRRLEASLPGDQRLGALPKRERVQDREGVPELVAGSAADAPAAPDRPSGPQLEVLRRGRRRTSPMGRLSEGVLRGDLSHEH